VTIGDTLILIFFIALAVSALMACVRVVLDLQDVRGHANAVRSRLEALETRLEQIDQENQRLSALLETETRRAMELEPIFREIDLELHARMNKKPRRFFVIGGRARVYKTLWVIRVQAELSGEERVPDMLAEWADGRDHIVEAQTEEAARSRVSALYRPEDGFAIIRTGLLDEAQLAPG
jgi:hypothetical protein